MLRVAIEGLSLDHREANESVTDFLRHFIRAASDNPVSSYRRAFQREGRPDIIASPRVRCFLKSIR